ncbi:MAG: hypothetical protein ACTHXA_08905 [Gulosibacter sp.]|uniref:hypothetical protein n=1 Tax=Gulosibacter sp. TaxID=2817531 RepID=UPI003F8EBB93
MVDRDLLEKVLQLDAATRRELRDAIDDSLHIEVDPELASQLDARIREADAHPDDHVSWGDVRARGQRKISAAKKSA